MTTQSSLRIFGFMASMLILSNSFAQLSTVNNLQPALNQSSSIKIFENVDAKFQKLFSGAQNVGWEKLKNRYLAKFTIDDVKMRVLLSPKGKVIYKITYGTEKHLPADIRKNIKRNYVEFVITSAILVEQSNRTIWVVNVEDDSSYAVIRVENDEIEEVLKYSKTK